MLILESDICLTNIMPSVKIISIGKLFPDMSKYKVIIFNKKIRV